MIRNFGVTVTIFFLLAMQNAAAESARTIRIEGRKSAVVTTSGIRLGDLAEVQSPRIEDDEAVIGLKKIWIGNSPQPGKEITLSASEVLSKVKDQGVDLNRVGYVFPRMMTISRAARTVSAEEVTEAITRLLLGAGNDVSLKSIKMPQEIKIAPGLAQIEAVRTGGQQGGRMSFQLKAKIDGEPEQIFPVEALVEEYREVPTAKRPINKGSVVNSEDVVMARFNVNMLPVDAADKDREVVGHAASHDISAGEVFRATKLELPRAVTKGDKVTLLYRRGLLEASATGISLDDGAVGQEVKVKNDASKKVVTGKIIEPGLVGVH